MIKSVIIAGGMPPTKELVEKEIYGNALIICADGGANCLFRYNILPDLIIGDGDSLDKAALDFFTTKNVPFEWYPKDKSYTDSKLALQKAIQLGVEEIVFLGCLGNRSDHVLGNLSLLAACQNLNVKAFLKDDHNTIQLINKPTYLSGKCGEKFSLQAYSEVVNKLNVTGGKFELKNYDLCFGDALTLSNEFLDTKVHIEFTNGQLLIFTEIVNDCP
jgi:thiamine pyrophosphokinase